MKRTNWIVSGIVLLSSEVVVYSAVGPAAPPAVAQKIKVQEARVPVIEAQAAGDRQQVQRWYEARRTQIVGDITRRAAAELSLPEREQWVEYADLYLNHRYAPAFFDGGFLTDRAALLGNALTQEYLISAMANLLASQRFEQKLEQIVAERLEVPLLPLLQDRVAELLTLVKNVRAEVTIELRQLENEKAARLGAIMEREKDLKEQVHGILDYLRQSESRPVRLGVVESVGYCVDSGYYCTIEGVDNVLGVGDTVGAVRVLKIDPDQVEFAKDGTTWAQSLGAPPQSYWQRTE